MKIYDIATEREEKSLSFFRARMFFSGVNFASVEKFACK